MAHEPQSGPPADNKNPMSEKLRATKTTWCALYGFLLVSIALTAYGLGVALGPVRWLFLNPPLLRQINEAIVWYSGIPLVAGTLLICWDLFGHVRRLRSLKSIRNNPPSNLRLTVVLTAYNDERSIGGAVLNTAGILTYTAKVTTGISKFTFNIVTGVFTISFLNISPDDTMGGTGLPLAKSGTDIVKVDMNLSFVFDLSDSTKLSAGRFMYIGRTTAAAKSWKLR